MHPEASEGLQFSIKQLLVITTLVGVVVSCGKAIKSWDLDDRMFLSVSLIIIVLSACLILIELATFWAALGIGRPLPRLIVVLSAAFVIGLIPVFYFNPNPELKEFLAWSCITGIQASITAATLLVLRSYGWRLSRRVTQVRLPAVGDAGGGEEFEPAAAINS